MADTIEMIQLSPTMEEGLLVAWLKHEGDTVAVGDLIAEVETDKASMEMESFYDGTILKILVPDGSSVRVGTPLAIIGEPGEDITHLLASASSAPGTKAPTTDAPSSADAAASSPAPTPAAAPIPTSSTPPKAAPHDAPHPGEARVLSSPVARRIADDHDLSVADIPGSGPAGRVIKRDVEAAIAQAAATATSPESSTHAAPPASAPAPVPASARVPLSPMRRAIARNTTDAWSIPAFMLTRVIRMDAALALRKDANAALERAGSNAKVSVNDLIIKASALALRDVPAVNVAFEGDALRQYEQSRIGVAVALDGGLITPVVANAEEKSLGAIATEVRELAERAKAKKLAPHEYADASFSISNLGMFGIEHFTAVLNPPGAAILAVGATSQVLVPDASERGFSTEQQLRVTLTCDHRALDGAVGAQWLQRFAAYLEEPFTLLL